VRQAGTTDSEKLREALLTLKTKTILGEFAVDQRGFQTGQKAVTIQWQDGSPEHARIVVHDRNNLLPFRHGRFGLFPGQPRPMIDLRYSIYDRGRVRCDLLIGEVRRDIGKPSITVFQVSGSGGRR